MDRAAVLDAESAPAFLRGRVPLAGRMSARLLAGGVSNTVVLVENGAQRVVLKQSLARLRVRDEWLADRSRILREWEALRALRRLLPASRVPEPLFLDEARFLYAMRAAPPGSADWKTRLLAGDCSERTARQAGSTLGLMIRATWGDAACRERFADRAAFDQLRTDPYFRTAGARHPRIAALVERWIETSSARRVALVHGDWSPKNLLVHDGGIVCIDFECAHFGDPSYDAGFMLNHLILKAFRRPGLAPSYLRLARIAFAWTLGMLPPAALEWFEAASVRHLAFLLLARVDGKSPVEYLDAEDIRDRVRRLALRWIDDAPPTVESALGAASEALRAPASNRATGLPRSP